MTRGGAIAVGLALVIATGSLAALGVARNAMTVNREVLPVDFVHADHTSVGCVDCHHNYVDDTGQGFCYACHKEHEDIAAETEQMFHDFCRGCHVEKAIDGEDGGPPRVCGQCHHPNDAFM